MFVKILLFSTILTFLEAIPCLEIYKDKDEFFKSIYKEPLLINTNQADFENIQSIGQEILQLDYSFYYQIDGIFISATLLKSFSNWDIQQICYLMINENTYFIQCIVGFTFSQEKMNFEYSNKTLIITQYYDKCESIFYDADTNFTIFCYSEDYFKLISTNLDDKNSLYIQYNYTQTHNFKYCKLISIQIRPYLYLIGSINCSDWSIFKAQDNNITLFLDKDILRRMQLSFDLINLVNIQVCQISQTQQYFFYLLFDQGYIQMENFQILEIILLNQQDKVKITQFVFDKSCQIRIFVGEEESLIPFQYYQQFQILSFSKSKYPLFLYQHEQFKIFQYEKSLQLFINQIFIQYYDISGLLLFYRTFNYLFVIDQSLNLIKLFKIKHLSNYIVPQYEYIYELSLHDFSCCKVEAVKCSKITLINSTNRFVDYQFFLKGQYYIHNSQEIQLFINYKEFMVGIPLHFEIPSQFSDILSIDQNIQNFSDICQLYRVFQNLTLLLYDSSAKLFVFSDEKFIYFYNCNQQKMLHQFKKQGKSVFNIKNKIIVLDKIYNLLNIITATENQLIQHNLKIDSDVTKVLQIQNSMIISFKNKEPLIIDFSSSDLTIQNAEIKIMETIQFYFKFQNSYQIYQVQDYLWIIKNKDILKMRFLECQILAMNQAFFFIVLHKVEYQLKVCFFNMNELLFIQNINLFDYSIYKPLTYAISNYDFFIIAEKSNQLYLLIYQFTQSNQYLIKLIIKVAQPNFYANNKKVYYYDENNLLVFQDQQQISLTYKIEDFSKLFQIVDLHLNLISLIDIKQQNKFNLKLKIINTNKEIFPKSNLIIHPSQNLINKIEVFNHFSGPIEIISLNDECPFNLNGPFQIRKGINLCNQNTTQNCLLQQQFERFEKCQCLFLKIMENQDLINKPKLIVLSFDQQHWFQLRNGDIIFINVENGVSRQAISYKFDVVQDRFVQFKEFDLPFQNEETNQIRIIGNLIYFQIGYLFYLFQLKGVYINKIYETTIQFEIIYLQNSDDEYIVINQEKNILITHYDFSDGRVNPIQTYNLDKIKILQLVEIQIDFLLNSQLIDSTLLILIEAIKVEKSIQIYSILNYQDLTFYINFSLNTQNKNVESIIIQILRKMETLDNIILINKQLAIFGTQEEKFYLYDFRQENQIYDSINIINFSKLHLQVYNNTHYILFNMQNKEPSLVEIGFEINITNKLEFTQCLLKAENWISKAEVKVIIQQEEYNNIQNKENIIIISISLIFILIVCLIFILRRQQLKQFQSISLDQSKIE